VVAGNAEPLTLALDSFVASIVNANPVVTSANVSVAPVKFPLPQRSGVEVFVT